MNQVFEWFSGPLDSIARSGAPTPLMIILALVMFGGWTATYVTLIVKSFRDKSYGIPFPNTCLNASWELIFSFNLAGGLPLFAFPLRWGHIFWLLPNSINIYQTWKYGSQMQPPGILRQFFRPIFASTFLVSFAMIYSYHYYARDVYGVASSWIINVFMSWLFIHMLVDRKHLVAEDGTIRGMSVPAAWFKLVGNAAGAVFCYFWWPAQFGPGQLLNHNGMPVMEPESYMFLYVLYGVNLTLDGMLIVLLRRREAEIRAKAQSPVDAGGPVFQLV